MSENCLYMSVVYTSNGHFIRKWMINRQISGYPILRQTPVATPAKDKKLVNTESNIVINCICIFSGWYTHIIYV